MLGGFLLYGAAAAAGLGREDAGVVEREPHGEGTAVHRLAVDGLLEKETEIDVPVNGSSSQIRSNSSSASESV